MTVLRINFTPATNGINIVVRHDGQIVDRQHTYNVMNTLDNGFFKSFIAGGYAVEEMSIAVDSRIDAYDIEYINRAWEMFTEN